MGVNVSEQNREKTANILALAIYPEKGNSVVYADFIDSFSAAVPTDGGCFGSVLLRNIHANRKLEEININFHPNQWFVCIFKEYC